jgi:hypothetical protein
MVIGLGDTEQELRRPTAPDPPNLRGTVLARADSRKLVDLKDLDRFHSPAEKDSP